MSKYNASMDRDANFQTIWGPLPFKSVKRITFDGGTANAIGDDGGTNDPFTIFTVTGDVLVIVLGVCITDLTGASATLSLGVAGATTTLANVITATTIDANTVLANGDVSLLNDIQTAPRVIAGGLDIIGTVGTADITAGVIDFYCFWRPLSSDGLVVGD